MPELLDVFFRPEFRFSDRNFPPDVPREPPLYLANVASDFGVTSAHIAMDEKLLQVDHEVASLSCN